MDKDDLELLFAYNRWANAKVREASQWVSPELLYTPAEVSFGSLMGTLAHILAAEINWRLRLQEGLSPTFMMTVNDFPSLAALNQLWDEEELAMRNFIDALTPEDVNRWVAYTTTSGKPQGSTMWKALVHVVNHGTQFRGEAGVVLTGFGHSPGDLDLVLFLREEDKR